MPEQSTFELSDNCSDITLNMSKELQRSNRTVVVFSNSLLKKNRKLKALPLGAEGHLYIQEFKEMEDKTWVAYQQNERALKTDRKVDSSGLSQL